MTAQPTLIDHASRDDLRVFLERLQRVGQPEVRLLVRDGTMAVFGCTQAPRGLTDPLPVVLAVRGFALAAGSSGTDVTVQNRALLARLARMGRTGLELELPDAQVTAAWAGVLPPFGGWQSSGVLDAASLAEVAEQGMARVAEALPDDPGEAVVRAVRARVWGAEVAPGVPAAAAFAAETMGFLRDERQVLLARTLTWTRLSTGRGQILVRALLG